MTAQELCSALVDINERSAESQIFFSYSPHVQTVSVQCYWAGWKEDRKHDYNALLKIDEEGMLIPRSKVQDMMTQIAINKR